MLVTGLMTLAISFAAAVALAPEKARTVLAVLAIVIAVIAFICAAAGIPHAGH